MNNLLLNEILEVLRGDGLRGEPGVIQNLMQTMRDFYGPKDDKTSGALPRLKVVEDQQKKWIWFGGGAVGLICLEWVIAWKFFGK